MKKNLFTLFAVLAFASTFAAQSDHYNEKIGEPKNIKTFDVEIRDQDQSFEIDVKTTKDMPNAVGLEIGSLSIMVPQKKVPGVISLSLRPAGDAWIDVVGPQYGSFTFLKGEKEHGLPQYLPLGRYLLTIDGEVYGILVIKLDQSVLYQELRKNEIHY